MSRRLAIDRLHLTFANGAGQEHRVRPIVRRALTLLDRAVRSGAIDPGQTRLGRMTVPPLQLDLMRLGDEAAASRIAAAIVGALAQPAAPLARPAGPAAAPARSEPPDGRGEAPCRR